MDVSGADSATNSSEGMTQIMGGGLKRRAQSPPSICIEAGEACSTLRVQGCLEDAFSIEVTVDDWIYRLSAVQQQRLGHAGLPGGCLSLRMSRVVKP